MHGFNVFRWAVRCNFGKFVLYFRASLFDRVQWILYVGRLVANISLGCFSYLYGYFVNGAGEVLYIGQVNCGWWRWRTWRLGQFWVVVFRELGLLANLFLSVFFCCVLLNESYCCEINCYVYRQVARTRRV